MDFAYENIGISHLCAKTTVFLHTFGEPSETLKNQYKSILAVFPLNWEYKNGTNKAKYGPCSLCMDPVHNLHVFGILWGMPWAPPRYFLKITTFQKLKNRGIWASRPIKSGRKPNLEKLCIILSQIGAIWTHFKANPSQKQKFPTKIPKNSDAQKN